MMTTEEKHDELRMWNGQAVEVCNMRSFDDEYPLTGYSFRIYGTLEILGGEEGNPDTSYYVKAGEAPSGSSGIEFRVEDINLLHWSRIGVNIIVLGE